MISVEEAARHLGRSERWVRAMLADGRLDGERIARRWLVDPASLPVVPVRAGRTAGVEMAWSLIALSDGDCLDGLSAVARHRLRRRFDELLASPDPLPLLRALLDSRAERHRLHVDEPEALLVEDAFIASGRSDPRSGMYGPDFAEGYVRPEDLRAVRRRHLAVEAEAGERHNLVVHVGNVPEGLRAPVPLLLVAADLAQAGSREAQQAEIILRDLGRYRGVERDG